MEISALQVGNRQNIPGGPKENQVEASSFSTILAKLASLGEDGEGLELVDELLPLGDEVVLEGEEEEEVLTFDPINIPWILRTNQSNPNMDGILGSINQEQLESLEGSLGPIDGNINPLNHIESLVEEETLVAEIDPEISKDFFLEVNKELKPSMEEKVEAKGRSISGSQGSESSRVESLESESKEFKLEGLDLKKDTKSKLDMEGFKPKENDGEVKLSKKDEIDLSPNHLQRFRLEKPGTNEISTEGNQLRNIDFDDNLQRVNDSIIELMDLKTDGADSSMRVKLNPEELGFVDLTLKMEEGKLVAKILVENDQVRELFNNHMNSLNDKLARQNISVERVEIDVNLNFNDQSNSSDNQKKEKDFFEARNRILGHRRISNLSSKESQVNTSYSYSSSGLNILA